LKKPGYMIKIFAVLFALAIGLFPFGAVSAAGEATVTASAPASVNPGQQFTVNIAVVPGATPVAGIQFDLAFNPSLVTVDSVAQGNLLSQGGASTYFVAGTKNNVVGILTGVAGAITAQGQSVNTPGTFAVITMTAGAQGGISPLTLSSVVVGDVNGQPVSVIVTSGQVDVNNAPVLSAIGAQSGNEGDPLTFSVSATDADGDPMTYSALSLPEGSSFDPGSRTFSWTPRFNQAGVYMVRFQVSDGSLTDYEDVPVTAVKVGEDWDVNVDGNANVLDMILVGQSWSESGLTAWIREDCNEDGTINVLDMIIIGQHWTG
jgi:Putative Ig domain/Cohesin domain